MPHCAIWRLSGSFGRKLQLYLQPVRAVPIHRRWQLLAVLSPHSERMCYAQRDTFGLPSEYVLHPGEFGPFRAYEVQTGTIGVPGAN